MKRSTLGCWTAAIAVLGGLLGFGASNLITLNQIRATVAGPGLVGYGENKVGMTVTVGGGLTLVNGVLTATTAVPPVIPTWDTAKLVADTGGAYPLPSNALTAGLRVTVNGLRYISPDDYSVIGGKVVPACTAGPSDCNWPLPQDTTVVVDYQR